MEVYQQIYKVVYGAYRPWLMEDTTASKFRELYYELKAPRPLNELYYTINFQSPISYKRKFYFQLIYQDVVKALNTLHQEISKANTPNQKRYYVHAFIHQFINPYCHNIKHIIQERQLSQTAFEPKEGVVPKGNAIDEAYIFHYLKHQMIRLYLEVCAGYPAHIKEPITDIEQAYSHYFSEIPGEQILQLRTDQKL